MSWYSPSEPQNIVALPWLSKAAIAYLESLLTPDMNVIEFGGGGSTLWLAERVKSVVTYETDDDWYRIINALRPANVSLRFAMSHLSGMDNNKDLLLIDGEPIEYRGTWLVDAPSIVKAGGYVVLDNANRPEYARERAEFMSRAELLFTSPIEGKHLVTEFYRMKG